MKLSWRFICCVLFCERDEHRLPVIPKKRTGITTLEALRKMLLARGIPAHEVDERAAEMEARGKGQFRKGIALNPRRRQTSGGRKSPN
jgi:hypothetical protein